MIAFLGFILLFFVGVSLLFLLNPKLSLLLRTGMAFPAGFGILATSVFILELISVPYTLASSVIALVFFLLLFVFLKWRSWEMYFREQAIQELKALKPKSLHLAWILFFACLCFVVYAITVKSLFWPTTAYDSIAGYDYVAKVTAAEGTLNNSLNDPLNYTFTLRTLYPPLVPISFAFAYLCGLATSKIVCSIFFISLLITFYGLIRYYSTHFNAVVFTLLLAMVPELLAMSALSLSNIPSVFFTTAGVGALILFLRNQNKSFLWLSICMLSFAVFTRSEGIVYAAAAGFIFLFWAVPRKKWKLIGIFAAVPLVYYISWELYLKYVWQLSEHKQPFIYKLFFDADRLSILMDNVMKTSFTTQYFGLTVYIFIAAVLISIRSIYLKKQSWHLLAFIFTSWLMYVWVFYQMDIFDEGKLMAGGGGYIASGYKRGFFNFCALMLLFSAITLPVRNFFGKWLS